MTLADRIVDLLMESPDLDDDQISARLGVARQHVNVASRTLAAKGVLQRFTGPSGKIVNRLAKNGLIRLPSPPPPSQTESAFVSEDEVKAAVKRYLEARGYEVRVAWGRHPGTDIEATGRSGRFLIEAKGEVASQPQKTNYFLGAIGELVERMSDEQATYGLTLPDNRTYRRLVQRLLRLAKNRLRLRVLFVGRAGRNIEVEEIG